MMTCLDFDALKELHNSANELLHSPKIQHSLIHDQKKWANEVSEATLTMLDMCAISKDVLSLLKQHVQDIELMMRRQIFGDNKQDLSDKKIADYNKMKKAAFKCLKGMKKNKSRFYNLSRLSSTIYADDNLMEVVQALREVKGTSVGVVESLLGLFDVLSLDINLDRRSTIVSKFMYPRNPRVHDVICNGMVQSTDCKRFEEVGVVIEALEVKFEFIFRRLIQTRVSLLNILTD